MKRLFLSFLAISNFTNCSESNSNKIEKGNKMELIIETKKKLNEKKELDPKSCVFSEPDTSVSGIIIGNAESTSRILGNQIRVCVDSANIFYSIDKKQKLELTIHPGDLCNQVSIFKISYSKNLNQNFQQISSKLFETEKGIKLGMSKLEIIERLGTCYLPKDSTKNSLELYYNLEFLNDNKSKFLKRNNMPSYFARYILKNDKLENLEFGFEYP